MQHRSEVYGADRVAARGEQPRNKPGVVDGDQQNAVGFSEDLRQPLLEVCWARIGERLIAKDPGGDIEGGDEFDERGDVVAGCWAHPHARS